MARRQAWMLVVMADAVRRMALFRALEAYGYRATVAGDTAAALELLRSEPFDVVLLDGSGPPHAAAAMLRGIKADPRLGSLGVLVVCATHGPGAGNGWVAMGADDVLALPFDAELLRARIASCLM
jgi:DNA-binding response OmpR family regulator